MENEFYNKVYRPVRSAILGRENYIIKDLSDKKYENIKKELNGTVKELFHNAKYSKIKIDEKIMRDINYVIDNILEEKNPSKMLDHVKNSTSNNVFVHSIDVCLTSVTIGHNHGFNKYELIDLGLGAILHDVGKSQMMHIIDKKDSLTNDEWSTIKSHPWLGYRILKQNGIEDIICDMALEHHMPQYGHLNFEMNKKLSEMSVYSKIVTVADVYSALTEDRPYRKAMKRDQIINVMKDMALNNLLSTDVIKYMK